jgi:hypothetical protein
MANADSSNDRMATIARTVRPVVAVIDRVVESMA